MSENDELREGVDAPQPSRWRRNVAIAIAAVFLLSAAARGFLPGSEPHTKSGGSEQSMGFVPGEGAPAAEQPEPTKVQKALPYITEGSFFALIGFALGYLSRTILKIGLIVLGAAFLLIQGLAYAEIIDVDWSRAIDLTNHLVLNLKDNATWGEVLKDKLPSTGALGAGYALGFRR